MDEESIELSTSFSSSMFQYELIMIENNNAWFHKEICGFCDFYSTVFGEKFKKI